MLPMPLWPIVSLFVVVRVDAEASTEEMPLILRYPFDPAFFPTIAALAETVEPVLIFSVLLLAPKLSILTFRILDPRSKVASFCSVRIAFWVPLILKSVVASVVDKFAPLINALALMSRVPPWIVSVPPSWFSSESATAVSASVVKEPSAIFSTPTLSIVVVPAIVMLPEFSVTVLVGIGSAADNVGAGFSAFLGVEVAPLPILSSLAFHVEFVPVTVTSPCASSSQPTVATLFERLAPSRISIDPIPKCPTIRLLEIVMSASSPVMVAWPVPL